MAAQWHSLTVNPKDLDYNGMEIPALEHANPIRTHQPNVSNAEQASFSPWSVFSSRMPPTLAGLDMEMDFSEVDMSFGQVDLQYDGIIEAQSQYPGHQRISLTKL